MSHTTSSYPALSVDGDGSAVVSHAGSVLLTTTATTIDLDGALTAALAPWRAARAVHDPGKITLDLAISIAIGGDALSDLATLRAEPAVFGLVASDPTVSRLIDTLADHADGPTGALAAIEAARAQARQQAWTLAGSAAPDAGTDARRPLTVDIDATLVGAHSEKELAASTFKKGFGFHPICAFLDHGADGTGEPLALHLRPGNAGSNTAADHITLAAAALAQLPGYTATRRPGRAVLIRTDGGGGTHAFLDWLTRRRLSYSVGFTLPGALADVQERLARIPEHAWYPAVDGDSVDGLPAPLRDGAWVAEATGVFNLTGWPKGMRLIVRKERPHPGAQLRITDLDGHRITAFVTNTVGLERSAQLPQLELRHRRRARAEDRIRTCKDTGLRNLPLHDFNQNRVWLALVALASDLLAWTQMLAFTTDTGVAPADADETAKEAAGTADAPTNPVSHPARRWEPKRLRHRLFSIAGRLARHARRRQLHLAREAPFTALLLAGLARLAALDRAVLPAPAPG